LKLFGNPKTQKVSFKDNYLLQVYFFFLYNNQPAKEVQWGICIPQAESFEHLGMVYWNLIYKTIVLRKFLRQTKFITTWFHGRPEGAFAPLAGQT
jgi:hypothetical protein